MTEALHSLPRLWVLPRLLRDVRIELGRGTLLLLPPTARLGQTAAELRVRERSATFDHYFILLRLLNV